MIIFVPDESARGASENPSLDDILPERKEKTTSFEGRERRQDVHQNRKGEKGRSGTMVVVGADGRMLGDI